MKRILIFLGIVSLFTFGTVEAKPKMRFTGNFGVFYSSLSPHGEWVEVDFGYAWRPLHINHRWRPYLYGRWVWTDYGWYWASSEPFGWATYHYGRWTYDDYYGWIWIPDDTWGPAWVEWRYDNNYVGWAPLTPNAQFVINVGIVFSNNWIAPVHYWNFVPCRQFTSRQIVNYVEPVERTRRIFGNTRGATMIRTERDRVFNGGVDVRTIERRGNVRINRVEVVERDQQNADRISNDSHQMRVGSFRPKFDERTRGTSEIPSTLREENRSTGRERNARVYGTDRPKETESRNSEYRNRESRGNIYQEPKESNKREQRESAIDRIQKERNVFEQQRTQQREERSRESYRQREQQEKRQQIQSQSNRGNQRNDGQRDQGRTQQQGEQRTRGRRPG